jgi:hypothetical protein
VQEDRHLLPASLVFPAAPRYVNSGGAPIYRSRAPGSPHLQGPLRPSIRVLTTDSLSPRGHTARARDLLKWEVYARTTTQGSAMTILATFPMKSLELSNP